MLLSNLFFDIVLFGGLLIATLLDSTPPASSFSHGAASLAVACFFIYAAAQELCAALERRGSWSHESLATSLAVTTALFVYYFGRNDSDLSLFVLSVGTMMVALMAIIALIGVGGAVVERRSAVPLLGLLLTIGGALLLGALASMLVLVLSSGATLGVKLLVLLAGAVIWKGRERLSPPIERAQVGASTRDDGDSGARTSSGASTDVGALSSTTHGATAPLLAPRHGLLLDRLIPVLLLGAVCFFALKDRDKGILQPVTPPADASNLVTAARGASKNAMPGKSASSAATPR